MSSKQASNVPSSFIKAPGALFVTKKTPLDFSSSEDRIKSLFQEFKVHLETVDQPTPSKLRREEFGFTRQSNPCIVKFFTENTSDEILSPGRLMSSSSGLYGTLMKAKELLSMYGIELSVDSQSSNVKEMCSALNTLITEIQLFPFTFLKKIKIDQIILSKTGNCSFETLSENVLFLGSFENQDKILSKFYKTLLDNITKQNPQLMQEWEEKTGSPLPTFEEVFIALMRNSNHALGKHERELLKELLVKHYPLEMSEDWFQNRKKEKKKMCKVRFDISREDLTT